MKTNEKKCPQTRLYMWKSKYLTYITQWSTNRGAGPLPFYKRLNSQDQFSDEREVAGTKSRLQVSSRASIPRNFMFFFLNGFMCAGKQAHGS